jgi:hypothetical protein
MAKIVGEWGAGLQSLIESVEDAHEGFDDSFLEHFCVVLVCEVHDAVAGNKEEVNDALQVGEAAALTLEEELAEAHEDVEFEFAGDKVFLNKRGGTSNRVSSYSKM